MNCVDLDYVSKFGSSRLHFMIFGILVYLVLSIPFSIQNSDVEQVTKASTGSGKIVNTNNQNLFFPKLIKYIRNALISVSNPYSIRRKGTINETQAQVISNDEDDFILNELLEGIEESMLSYPYINETTLKDVSNNILRKTSNERRGLPIYLFQGHYLAEPRLNRFIDGAMANLAKEMSLSSLDPTYFQVLPRGRLMGRPKPIRRFPAKIGKRRRRRPFLVQRRPLFRSFRSIRLPKLSSPSKTENSGLNCLKESSSKLCKTNYQSNQSTIFNRGRQFQLLTLKKQQLQQKRRRAGNNNANNRRKIVGAGRIDGLSKVFRDGDAEMQLFGNYTLIRSHQNIGPIHLLMRFRTIRGIRRAEATLDDVKIHTVTRVNTQGCEMIDFLLDRPHPETIHIRTELFPLAKRVSKAVFSKLFNADSFLVARIREKTGLALLSKRTAY